MSAIAAVAANSVAVLIMLSSRDDAAPSLAAVIGRRRTAQCHGATRKKGGIYPTSVVKMRDGRRGSAMCAATTLGPQDLWLHALQRNPCLYALLCSMYSQNCSGRVTMGTVPRTSRMSVEIWGITEG